MGPKKTKISQVSRIEPANQILSKALIRLSEELALNRQELCTITGMSEASMSRFFDHKRFIQTETKEGEIALLLLRIYRSLDAIFGGNKEPVRLWFRAYNHHLNGVPAELIQTISGLVEVTLYLDAIRGKI